MFAVVIHKQYDQPLAARLVPLIEPGEQRAVEVEHTRDLAALDQRHDQFGTRRRVATDMAREIVDVRDQNRRAARGRGAANAVAERDTHTGGFTLEWPQNQLAAPAKIKAGPVEVREA